MQIARIVSPPNVLFSSLHLLHFNLHINFPLLHTRGLNISLYSNIFAYKISEFVKYHGFKSPKMDTEKTTSRKSQILL